MRRLTQRPKNLVHVNTDGPLGKENKYILCVCGCIYVCVCVYTQANVHAHMQIHITDKQAEDGTWMDLA